MLVLVISIMVSLALLQAPSLVNQKQWGELAGFGAMWIFATTYAILITADVPIPNPTELLRPVLEAFYRLIGLNITL